MKNIKLGSEVKDTITGFEGIAIERCTYLNGCVQYGIQKKIDEKGEIPLIAYIDVEQLKVISTSPLPKSNPSGGGHRSHPH